MAIKKGTLDELLSGRDPKQVFSKDGLVDELKKALAERVLNAEMDQHLDGEAAAGKANHRNGYSKKTVLTDSGKLRSAIPRDRAGTFDPQLIAKYQRRFPGFDDKIVSMYARGMTVREIQGHLMEIYGIDVSPDLICAVTDAVLERSPSGRTGRSSRCIRWSSSMRCGSRSATKAWSATRRSISRSASWPTARKEILGLWIEQTEGAKFWLRVMNELKNRGVEDILIAVVDGLKGFPEAITAVFPRHQVQTCIVHLIRHSLEFVSWKDRKAVAGELKDDLPRQGRRSRRGGAGQPSMPARGGANTRRSPRAGGATGPRSSRSLPSPSRSGGSSTPPTPSKP